MSSAATGPRPRRPVALTDPVAAAVRADAGAAPDWPALRERALACTACPQLAATRRQVVFASSPPGLHVGDEAPAPPVMLVGEAPGATEDERGEPFVGKAGQLLDRLLAEAGLDRAAVVVTNTVKCRPPRNRTPTAPELRRCSGWLDRQLALARPRVVVTLGLTAASWFLGAEARRGGGALRLAAVRGRAHSVGGRLVLPTYHPSAALRFGPAGAPLAALRDDLALVAGLLAAPAPAPLSAG